MKPTRTILPRLPAPLIVAAIWFTSSQSTLPKLPGPILGWDKLQHLVAYAALGFAVGLWIPRRFRKRRPGRAILLSTLIGSAYGAVDEIHQYFVPGRYCDVLDWVANTIGAFLGALAMIFVMRKLESPTNKKVGDSLN